MKYIKFIGWAPGLLKVDTTRLFQQYFNLSLKESKESTDRLLEGEHFTFSIKDDINESKIIDDFTKVGVKCIVQDENSI